MNAVDSIAPAVEPKARARKPRDPGVQASRKPGIRDLAKPDRPTPKNADAGMGKLSVYVPLQLLRKLTVATAAWDKDKSDIVSQSLAKTLSSIVFYDMNAPKAASATTCDTGDIGEAGAAA